MEQTNRVSRSAPFISVTEVSLKIYDFLIESLLTDIDRSTIEHIAIIHRAMTTDWVETTIRGG